MKVFVTKRADQVAFRRRSADHDSWELPRWSLSYPQEDRLDRFTVSQTVAFFHQQCAQCGACGDDWRAEVLAQTGVINLFGPVPAEREIKVGELQLLTLTCGTSGHQEEIEG